VNERGRFRLDNRAPGRGSMFKRFDIAPFMLLGCAAFLASCSVVCESVEKLQRALEPHTLEIRSDVKNYTDVTPVIWISDVVVG